MNKYDIKCMAYCARMFSALDPECDYMVTIRRNVLDEPNVEVQLLGEGLKEASEILGIPVERDEWADSFVYDGVKFFTPIK